VSDRKTRIHVTIPARKGSKTCPSRCQFRSRIMIYPPGCAAFSWHGEDTQLEEKGSGWARCKACLKAEECNG